MRDQGDDPGLLAPADPWATSPGTDRRQLVIDGKLTPAPGRGSPFVPAAGFSPHSVSITAPAVLLQGTALVDANHLLKLGMEQAQRRDGITPSARLRELLILVESTATAYRSMMSPPGRGISGIESDEASWELERATRLISTRKAAAIIGISERQVRRLGNSMGVDRVGHLLMFDEKAVRQHAASRATSKGTRS